MRMCPVCRVLMSDILIHLKGCAKTVPLHTALPANPRYWLGADSKATPVGLYATQSQVTTRATRRTRPWATNATHSHSYMLMELWFTCLFSFYSGTLFFCWSTSRQVIVPLYFSSIWTLKPGGWMGLSDYCYHFLHESFLKVPFLKEQSDLVHSSLLPPSPAVILQLLMVKTNCMTV